MLVKEISTGDENYPDYKNSMFKPEISSLPLYSEEKGTFKNVPMADGKVDARVQGMVKDFLMKREHELEEYAPKKLSDEQHGKINEITSYLTGKASSSFNSSKESKPSSDDFELDGLVSSGDTVASSASSSDEDDFFSDFN
jgi:hypothetical protein